MTYRVKDLIADLQLLDPELKVMADNGSRGWCSAAGVGGMMLDEDAVFLEMEPAPRSRPVPCVSLHGSDR